MSEDDEITDVFDRHGQKIGETRRRPKPPTAEEEIQNILGMVALVAIVVGIGAITSFVAWLDTDVAEILRSQEIEIAPGEMFDVFVVGIVGFVTALCFNFSEESKSGCFGFWLLLSIIGTIAWLISQEGLSIWLGAFLMVGTAIGVSSFKLWIVTILAWIGMVAIFYFLATEPTVANEAVLKGIAVVVGSTFGALVGRVGRAISG